MEPSETQAGETGTSPTRNRVTERVNSLRETENTLLGITNIYRMEVSSLVSQVRNPHLHHDIYMMQNIIPGKRWD